MMLNKLRYHYGTYRLSAIVKERSDLNGTEKGVFELDEKYSVIISYDADALHTSEIQSDLLINNRPVILSPSKSKTKKQVKDEIKDSSSHQLHVFDFPSPEVLALAREEDLRSLGMGYRAKFIIETAKKVVEKGGLSWFNQLREMAKDHKVTNDSTVHSDAAALTTSARLAVQEQLLSLHGVGRKVADCVALFSLDQCGAIPVDTHVWSIAIRDYGDGNSTARTTTKNTIKNNNDKNKNKSKSTKDEKEQEANQPKSLTPTVYEAVGDVFRDRFGDKAGWAHSVLFCAELPEFRALLPLKLQKEMKDFAADQKQIKSEEKERKKKEKG